MSASTVMSLALEELVRQFEAVHSSASELVQRLDEKQFNWQPAPDRWSIGQNIAHLNISAADTFPFLDAMLAKARAQGSSSEHALSRTLIGRLFVWVIEPPYRVRVKTRSTHVPRSVVTMASELALLQKNQDAYAARVRAGAGLNICAVKENLNLLAGNPKAPPANLNLFEWLLFVAAHERRHLWQAWQARNHPAFPAQ
jgi:hypothetical protein